MKKPKHHKIRNEIGELLEGRRAKFHGFPIQEFYQVSLPAWLLIADGIARNANHRDQFRAAEYLINKADGKPREQVQVSAEGKTLAGLMRALDRIRLDDDSGGS